MLESIRKNRKGILLMIISSICACIGQLLWKMSAGNGLGYVSWLLLLWNRSPCDDNCIQIW